MLNCRIVGQLLSAKITGGNANHYQPLVGITFLQFIQCAYLPHIHRLACQIDNQQDLAFVSRERNILAIQTNQGIIVDSLVRRWGAARWQCQMERKENSEKRLPSDLHVSLSVHCCIQQRLGAKSFVLLGPSGAGIPFFSRHYKKESIESLNQRSVVRIIDVGLSTNRCPVL